MTKDTTNSDLSVGEEDSARHESCMRIASKATLDRYYGGASQLDIHRMVDVLSEAAVDAYMKAFASGIGGPVAQKIMLGDDMAAMTDPARPDLDDMIKDFFRAADIPVKQWDRMRPHLRTMFALMAQQIVDLKERCRLAEESR